MTQQWQEFSPTRTASSNREDADSYPYYDVEEQLHQRLIRDIDEVALRSLERGSARESVERATRTLAAQMFPDLVGDAKEEVISRVVDEVIGLGPIEPLIRDNTVSEVMINAPGEVFFERDGVIFQSEIVFRDQSHINRVIDRIVVNRPSR